eukprot:114827_1
MVENGCYISKQQLNHGWMGVLALVHHAYFLPKQLFQHSIGLEYVRWQLLASDPSQVLKQAFKTKTHFRVLWEDVYKWVHLHVFNVMMATKNANVRRIAHGAILRINDINQFIGRVLIPMINTKDQKVEEFWRIVHIHAQINRRRLNAKKEALQWNSQSYEYEVHRIMMDPMEVQCYGMVNNTVMTEQQPSTVRPLVQPSFVQPKPPKKPRNKLCFKCNKAGHLWRQCPSTQQRLPHPPRGGRDHYTPNYDHDMDKENVNPKEAQQYELQFKHQHMSMRRKQNEYITKHGKTYGSKRCLRDVCVHFERRGGCRRNSSTCRQHHICRKCLRVGHHNAHNCSVRR